MRARMVVIVMLLVGLVVLPVPSAQAGMDPIYAVDAFFGALNAGNHESAAAIFSPDAVATLVRGEAYRGPDGMRALVRLLDYPGRHYEIVQAHMVGDTVTVVVAVSDRGTRWGEDTIVVGVRAGRVHTFHEQTFRLRLGS
jgi:hypothetical protein